MALNNFPEAEQALREAFKFELMDLSCLHSLGKAFFEAGYHNHAEKCFTYALQVFSKSPSSPTSVRTTTGDQDQTQAARIEYLQKQVALLVAH